MPHDDDLYDDYHDGHDDVDEDDRDPTYYESSWGGPDEEDLEEWEEEQDEDEEEHQECDYDEDGPPLPSPEPGNEVASRRHFADLKRKYQAESFKETSPLSQLYKILVKLESREFLDHRDLDWLTKNCPKGRIRMFAGRVALNCEHCFKEGGNQWRAVRACSFWRMAEKPLNGVKITETLARPPYAGDPKLKAAILTTRGGAFRDLKKLDEAEACAQQAIKLDQQYYPYMLLGAVYYQKGDPQRGDVYFAQAVNLGAKPQAQEYEIKKAVDQAGADEQRIVAQYLLNKDPIKYHWATKYFQ